MAEKEYIERDAVLDELLYAMCGTGYQSRAMDAVHFVPAADVAPVVHARWIDNHCTACGMMPMGEELWDSCEFAPPKFEFFMDYCPHCGARMDGGKHG